MEKDNIVYTNQRIEILNFLKGNTRHPSVDEIYKGVKKKLSQISKATVYQNLNLLAHKGLIQEVNIKGISRFDSNIKPHHHFICQKCGIILDFESKELTAYSLNIGKRIKNVSIAATDTHFYGLCNKCKSK